MPSTTTLKSFRNGWQGQDAGLKSITIPATARTFILDPIESLWGLMNRNVTHNRCYATYNDFCNSVLRFLREEVPKNWAVFCDSVTDNFRVINPADFRVLKA